MRYLLLFIFACLTRLQGNFAIKCYECNDPKCNDEFSRDSALVIDCDNAPNPLEGEAKAGFCRKLKFISKYRQIYDLHRWKPSMQIESNFSNGIDLWRISGKLRKAF